MAATAVETKQIGFQFDPLLMHALTSAVESALTMCDVKARCVGVTSVPAQEPGIITGMLGVHGKVSGFMTVNFSERFAVRAVAGLLQEDCQELSAQVVDGVGEITNVIGGGVKRALATTPWGFSHVTVPSVIVGSGYRIAYAKGLDFLCAVFEHDDEEAIMLQDRMLQVSISLLRL